jgi:hypothetical protein
LLKVRVLDGAIASESRPLIDEHVVTGLGGEPSHTGKAMRLTAVVVGAEVLGSLQNSIRITPSLVVLL